MRDRGTLYVGILLVLLGAIFFFVALGESLLGALGIRAGWGRLWPLLVLYVGTAFWLPFAIWWPRRAQFAGLAVPAAIVTTNGLMLLYQSLTGDWASWAYLWALELVAVAAGLFALYLLTDRPRGLLLAVGIVGGVGLLLLAIFATAFGGGLRYLAPVALVVIGLFLMMRGIKDRVGHYPRA
jgi:hypothetical protein